MTMIVDDREVMEHPDIPTFLCGIDFIVQRIETGDYVFLDKNSNSTGIERSEINDLMGKLRSGRLEEQLRRCSEEYQRVILLVEGVYDSVGGFLGVYRKTENGYYRNRIYPSTRYEHTAALLARLTQLGIEVLHTATFDCSMVMVQYIYQQANKDEDSHVLFKRSKGVLLPTKLTTNPAVPRLMALCPRLPERTSIRLLQQYGSIWGVLNADGEELLKVVGMGKGLLAKLYEGVGKV